MKACAAMAKFDPILSEVADSIKDFLAYVKATLGDAVVDVRASDRLTDSAVCLVAPDSGPDRALERILAGAGRLSSASKPILEVNPRHELVVALAALVLKERVRIYRWSAVTIGFVGVLVVLAPHFSSDELTIAMASATSVAGVIYAVAGSFTNAGTMIQTRHLTKSETTSSIVFYFSLICALAGLVTLPFGWLTPTGREFAALMCIGFLGGAGHILLTESYRYASASMLAPFDYTSMIWALVLGYAFFGELPTVMIVAGSAIVAAAGLFVIWRERQLALARRRGVEGTTTSLQTP